MQIYFYGPAVIYSARNNNGIPSNRHIMQYSDSLNHAVRNCQNQAPENTISHYVGLRHINRAEIGKYRLHPKGMEATFNAEKITGAQDLLSSLKKFEGIV